MTDAVQAQVEAESAKAAASAMYAFAQYETVDRVVAARDAVRVFMHEMGYEGAEQPEIAVWQLLFSIDDLRVQRSLGWDEVYGCGDASAFATPGNLVGGLRMLSEAEGLDWSDLMADVKRNLHEIRMGRYPDEVPGGPRP